MKRSTSYTVGTLLVALLLIPAANARAVTIALVPVGNPGNAADTTGYGAVDYSYSIGKYDVTTSQYTTLLNAVAATDPYGLWNNNMSNPFVLPTVGIQRSGSSGSYSYSVIGNGNVPVYYVTWSDAARFSNWLQNGQPTGAEGPGTTETGTYTLNGAITAAALMTVGRNPGATWFIPTENEWYKAAYYKGGGLNAGYWLYPTRNNSPPSNLLSATGTNNANFYDNGYTDPANYLTSVGAFAASPGPYGTFDQGGNVIQWNETAVTGSSRGRRSGSFNDTSFSLLSSSRHDADPTLDFINVGFRVASVPEPSTLVLAALGLAAGVVIVRRRTRHRLFTVGSLLVVALLFIPAVNARAGLLDGIGAMGSSTTDEYQFSPLHSTARNWVEILAATHGWNFGSFTTVSRGEPRNQGYEYDWGRVGATTGGLLTQGQATGLAAQVAGGQVTLGFLWIGTNDFRNVLNATVPPASLPPTLIPDAVTNFTTALNTVLAADPNVRIVVATTYDEAVLPYVRKRLASGQLSQDLVNQVSAGIQDYNAQITAIANADQRVAVTDLFGLFGDVMAPNQFSFAGLPMDRIISSAQPDHFFVDDFHPGTIGQGLIANAFIDTIDTQFGADAPRLTDAEIFGVAGVVVPEPSSLVLLGLGVLSLFGCCWRFRKRAQ